MQRNRSMWEMCSSGKDFWSLVTVIRSEFPFLCTSFLNIYPICGSCNKAKSDIPSEFRLYRTGLEINVFGFGLADNAVVQYLNHNDLEKIKIVFGHIQFWNAR
jgi:hypothetical protein